MNSRLDVEKKFYIDPFNWLVYIHLTWKQVFSSFFSVGLMIYMWSSWFVSKG